MVDLTEVVQAAENTSIKVKELSMCLGRELEALVAAQQATREAVDFCLANPENVEDLMADSLEHTNVVIVTRVKRAKALTDALANYFDDGTPKAQILAFPGRRQ